MRRPIGWVLAGVLVLSACGEQVVRVGTDAGPLDSVTAAADDPLAPPTPGPDDPGATPEVGESGEPDPSAGPTGEPTPGPSGDPDDEATGTPSSPPDGPSEEPTATSEPTTPTPPDPSAPDATPQPPPPPDLDLAGWEVRVVGIVDPARANVLNVFNARPVVVVLHALADTVADDPDGDPADDATTIDAVTVAVQLDSGQVRQQVSVFEGATTVECPAQVEARVVLRAGQGQRLCATFDVPATAEVAAVEVAAAGAMATVPIADVEPVDDVAHGGTLDVGVPEGLLALGEEVDVTVPGRGGSAEVTVAVTDVEVLAEPSPTTRIVGITLDLSAARAVPLALDADVVAAVATDGTQRIRLADETVSACRGSGGVEVPADRVVQVCIPVLVPEDSITTHVRVTLPDGPPQVWRVLQAGGTAGPGSNA